MRRDGYVAHCEDMLLVLVRVDDIVYGKLVIKQLLAIYRFSESKSDAVVLREFEK